MLCSLCICCRWRLDENTLTTNLFFCPKRFLRWRKTENSAWIRLILWVPFPPRDVTPFSSFPCAHHCLISRFHDELISFFKLMFSASIWFYYILSMLTFAHFPKCWTCDNPSANLLHMNRSFVGLHSEFPSWLDVGWCLMNGNSEPY